MTRNFVVGQRLRVMHGTFAELAKIGLISNQFVILLNFIQKLHSILIPDVSGQSLLTENYSIPSGLGAAIF
jgi:hypothetical protein